MWVGQTHLKYVKNVSKLCSTGSQNGVQGRGGPKCSKMLINAQKRDITQAILEVIFATFRHFWGIIFRCFLGVSLFRILCAFWVSNAAPRLPQLSQNGPKSVPGDTLWNVLKPLYLLCCRHMGRSWAGRGNHFFGDRSAKLSPRVF